MSISLEGVSKQRGRSAFVLQDITLHVERGLLAIVGPKASGKSALITLIGALARPSQGRLLVDGLDTRRSPAAVRSRVCLLTKGAGLYPRLTLYENLHSLALLRRGVDLVEADQQLGNALTEVGLHEQGVQRLDQLTPGERFRAAIAAARLEPRPYLLVEEPDEGLTPDEREQARLCLQRLAQETLVLVASRIAEGLERHASQIAVLNQGSLRYFGPVEKLLCAVRGRVWSFRIPSGDEPPLISGFTRTALSREADGTMVRGVSSGRPVSTAQPVPETLEDAYRWLLAGYDASADMP